MPNPKRLFLDDERFPVDDDWTILRSVEAAIAHVEAHGFPDVVSFDNDLGDRLPEGRDFAKWLVARDLDRADMPAGFAYTVHSQNPVAKQAIEGLLDGYLRFKAG